MRPGPGPHMCGPAGSCMHDPEQLDVFETPENHVHTGEIGG